MEFKDVGIVSIKHGICNTELVSQKAHEQYFFLT